MSGIVYATKLLFTKYLLSYLRDCLCTVEWQKFYYSISVIMLETWRVPPSAVKSLLATIKSIQINLFPSFFHSIVVVGLVSCSIWYCDFSFLCMYLVVLPTSLHTRCLDTFDYLWLNSKSGHLSFAVCDSIASYLLYIERVDLNSIFQLCSSSRKHWFNFEAILF